MAGIYHFAAQKESEECPAVPHAVCVWGESLHDATMKLASALKSDPGLTRAHPEFSDPELEEKAPRAQNPRRTKGS